MAAADLSRGSTKCSSGFTVEIESESVKRTGAGAWCRESEPHFQRLAMGIGTQLLRRERFFLLVSVAAKRED